MAVVVDATGTKLITTVAGASVNYTGITVGTGVNRALVVTVTCAAAVTAPNAHWDTAGANQAMTLISVVETQTNITTFMFGLRNPVSGAKTLNVAWTTSAKSNVEAISFTGVEQASDARAFTLANFAKDGATLNAITMGITPPRDSIVVASYGTSATFSSLNQTNLFTDITNTGCEGGATRATGAGVSISFTGTDTTTTGNKVMVGFAIISDSAPPTVPWAIPVWPKNGLASHLQSFIVAPVGPPKEDIPKVDRWLPRWEEGPKKSAFGVWEQQTLAWSPFVATSSIVASDDGSAGPRFQYRLIYRTKTEPVFVPTAAVTYTPTPQWPDRLAGKPSPLQSPTALVPPTQPTVWSQSTARWPELLPTRKRPVADFGTFVPPAQVNVSYASWPDFVPGKKLPTAEQQALAWTPLTPAVVTTVIDWDFATPIWSKPKVTQQQTLAFYPLPIPAVISTDIVASEDGSAGPRFRYRLIYRTKTEPVFVPAAAVIYSQLTSWPDVIPVRKRPVTDFRPWTFVPPPAQVFFAYAPWDDFTRRKKLLLDAPPLAWSGFTPTAVVTTIDWLRQFTDPVRRQIIPKVNLFPTVAATQIFSPFPSWDDFARRKQPPLNTQPLVQPALVPATVQVLFPYAPWDDFARKPAFAAWRQQTLAWSTFTPAAVFFLPDRWPDFVAKKKPPLNYEPLVLVQTVRTPWVTMTTWPDFAHLKRKPGLGAPYQQFTARFVGTVTATTITVSMSAFEVNSDTANAVVRVIQSQPAASALVSIEETGILIDPTF